MVPLNEPPTAAKTADSQAVWQLGLRFGVGAGVLCALWLLFLQVSGNNPLGPKQLLGELCVPLAAVGGQWLLRRKLAPARLGLGRSVGVGMLVILLAAPVAAVSAWQLARTVGEPLLVLNRAEQLEIIRAEQALRPKEKRSRQFEEYELQQVNALSASRLARGTFFYVLTLGMLGAVPAGIFLRK
ncbi:MAG: DUF4199 domain-containing protein [Hymenobacter sp.]|nr:MAG: DUF4199 domain-containing protein [Hymenobacter sp.]